MSGMETLGGGLRNESTANEMFKGLIRQPVAYKRLQCFVRSKASIISPYSDADILDSDG